MMTRGILIALLLTSPWPALGKDVEPLGQRPQSSARKLGTVPDQPLPNSAAMTRRIWAPGIDDGYVPQGLSVIGDDVYVGTYRSTDVKQSRGPCRLFRLNAKTGEVTGTLDLPPTCGHAGGLAKGVSGRLWVVDTRVMHEIELSPRGTPSLGRVLREVKIEAPLKGSFAAGDGVSLWLGGYERDKRGQLHRVPLAAIKGEAVGPGQATAAIDTPEKSQGAAIDGKGQLWVTMSGSKFGALARLDIPTGAIEAQYALPDGVEDISFDAAGFLWTVSEAGSLRWNTWATYFPVVFQLDAGRLK